MRSTVIAAHTHRQSRHGWLQHQSEQSRAFQDSAAENYDRLRDATYRATDRLFLWLLLVQGVARSHWRCASRHSHGRHDSHDSHARLPRCPFRRPAERTPANADRAQAGWLGTRYSIAVCQMLWSALLIHITSGRIETHFHVFGSLCLPRVLQRLASTRSRHHHGHAADHYLRAASSGRSRYTERLHQTRGDSSSTQAGSYSKTSSWC